MIFPKRYLQATLRYSEILGNSVTTQTEPQRLKNSEHVENDRPSSVMIPFMITNSMRAQLRELGLTEEEIYKIPTDRAHELLLQHQHVLSPNEDI